ncbi:MAG TPA: HTH domain-containing protein, partial [Gammaproteobacteria bacterium]|nr:HTH domain-containing protein [Gammaproteobacteria bacterium]
MHKLQPLLHLLADGRFHSGAALGEAIGIGRSAVWKRIRALEAMGLDIHAVRGKGYRLAAPLELLDRGRIVSALDRSRAGRLRGIEIFHRIDSTNRYLMERAAAGLEGPYLCLAEFQSAGRGRRGRNWVSPFGRNLCL